MDGGLRPFLQAEEAFFAADDEFFGAGFKVFPFLADGIGFVGVDFGVVFEGLGDGVEEFGEFAHHDAGLVEDGLVDGGMWCWDGVGDEEAARLVAEPADEADVFGEVVHFAEAVEGVFCAGLIGVFGVGGGLAPFVDEGRGDSESGGDGFDAGLVDGGADDFVGFHGGEL